LQFRDFEFPSPRPRPGVCPGCISSPFAAGNLIHITTNKHTDAEITLDAGEFGNCYSELLDAAESKYPKGGIQMKTSLSATANLSVARMEADDACLEIRALAVRRHRSTRC